MRYLKIRTINASINIIKMKLKLHRLYLIVMECMK